MFQCVCVGWHYNGVCICFFKWLFALFKNGIEVSNLRIIKVKLA
jgi:hypothetical protein